MKVVVNKLLIKGMKKSKDYLSYKFYKTPYLGAAHGTIGILYMIIKALKYLPDL